MKMLCPNTKKWQAQVKRWDKRERDKNDRKNKCPIKVSIANSAKR